MRTLFSISLAAGLILALQACATKGTPISLLGTPQFVPQSPPDSIVETGIRQDPNTGGIILQWFAMQSAAGYKIYRSDTTDGNGTPSGFAPVGNVISSTTLNDTSMVDANSIQTGVRYYYYLTAYTSDGSSSDPSDTINFKLLNRPGAGYPSSNASLSISKLYFSWYDATGGGYTVIRLNDITDIPSRTIWVTKKFQVFDSYPTRPFNFDSTATSQLISGHSYQWRVERFDIDGTGRPYEGSTSAWSTFTVK